MFMKILRIVIDIKDVLKKMSNPICLNVKNSDENDYFEIFSGDSSKIKNFL